MNDVKQCTKCNEVKKLEEFGRDQQNKSGLSSWCKKCLNEYQKQYYREHTEERCEYQHQYRKEHKEKIAARCKQYREEHREEIREKDRQYYQEHGEKIRERVCQYRKEHKEKVIECQRRWRKRNPEKVRAQERRQRRKYPERGYERLRRWRKANPYKVMEQRHRRRAHEIGAVGSFTSEEFDQLCKQCGNYCLRCGKQVDQLTLDHIVPLSKGGSNDISNIQPLCGQCNSSKGTKVVDYRSREETHA